jgi:hypothetical protein
MSTVESYRESMRAAVCDAPDYYRCFASRHPSGFLYSCFTVPETFGPSLTGLAEDAFVLLKP